jgi:CRISPR-associated exonuclease Cas4
LTELRGNLLITRGLRVRSNRLKVTGVCDVVEFHASPDGVPLAGRQGLWQPCPVEYKRGAPKEHDADELQLCCQAMCLEEMLACSIPEGSLYYGEPRRRVKVIFSYELRAKVEDMLSAMHQHLQRGHIPNVRPHKGCRACSLQELCLPKLNKPISVYDYLNAYMEEGGL